MVTLKTMREQDQFDHLNLLRIQKKIKLKCCLPSWYSINVTKKRKSMIMFTKQNNNLRDNGR